MVGNKAKIREDAMRLNPIDDALFQKMAEDAAFCEEMLQTILEDSGLKVLDNTPQFSVKNLQGRSCTLDLKCLLGNRKIVGIEVQRADDDDHLRRVRYDAALLTTNIANPSTHFRDVPDVIMIFITRFDIFKSGKVLYHVDRVIREIDKLVEDGLSEVYVNAEINDKSDVARLMEIFTKDNAYDDFRFPATFRRKRRFKQTEEGVDEMCEIIERNRLDAVVRAMFSLWKKGKLTEQEAADEAGISLEEFKKVVSTITAP